MPTLNQATIHSTHSRHTHLQQEATLPSKVRVSPLASDQTHARIEATPPRPIRLMLVSSQPMIRDLLRSNLETRDHLTVVEEADTIRSCLNKIHAARPHIVIVELCLSDGSGLLLIDALKACPWRCNVLILSTKSETCLAAQALTAGADGYVGMDEPLHHLIDAIHAVHAQGNGFAAPGTGPNLLAHYKHGRKPGSAESLSPREMETLVSLAQGLSLKETAARLRISEKTVSTYRRRLQDKLGLDGQASLVKYAINMGIV